MKKDTKMLHRLVGAAEGGKQDADNEAKLFEKALQTATDRVVVKRPLRAASFVSSRKPSSSVIGSTHRFEVYKLYS